MHGWLAAWMDLWMGEGQLDLELETSLNSNHHGRSRKSHEQSFDHCAADNGDEDYLQGPT